MLDCGIEDIDEPIVMDGIIPSYTIVAMVKVSSD